MTLGQHLAQLKAEAEILKQRQEKEEARLAEERKAKDLKAVALFFHVVKAQVTEHIEKGQLPPKTKLGDGENFGAAQVLEIWRWNDPACWIDKPNHEYHSVWQAFKAWATENELDAKWEYCWDGGGRSAWMELGVDPLST